MNPTDAFPVDSAAREAAWRTVARAAARLREASAPPPSLAELAADAGLSPSHFQRLFAQWMGVSPKRYQQHLAGRRALAALQGGADLLSASVEVGLSGPGRLHDLTVAVTAASPGEVKSGGAGLAISWGVASTPLGPALLAGGARGLMKLAFLDLLAANGAGLHARDANANANANASISTVINTGATADSCAGISISPHAGASAEAIPGATLANATTALAELRQEWPCASLRRDDALAARIARDIFSAWRGPEPLHLFVKGTQFQLRVWNALLRIPEGALVTYGELAAQLGDPGASRAVGSAVGANAIALLIPCHRVIRASGELGGYRWGEARKRLLLSAELAWQEQAGQGPSPA